MQLNLSSNNEEEFSPTNLSLHLLQEIYGQYCKSLTFTQFNDQELSLKVEGKTFTSLPEIVEHFLDVAGKTNDGFGNGKTEVLKWLTRIGNKEFISEQGLKVLEGELSTRTFLVGTTITVADLSLFASLHPYISKATHSLLLSHASITRHFNHIQNLPLVSSVLARSIIFQPPMIKIDTENVPLLEIKAEVRAPKKPVTAAAVAVGDPTEPAEVVAKVEKKVAEPTKVEGGKQEGVKKVKKEKVAGDATAAPKKVVAAPVVEAPAPWMIDLRVGTIIDVKRHPDADSLYVETIDVGEAEPRTVVSGLVNYMSIEQMQGRTLITVCNLKPANMRGVKSFAMVLCASSKDGKDGGIEFVDPPVGSKPGDRVYFEGFEDQSALDLLNPKKKIWEAIQPRFCTLSTKEAAWISEDKKVHKIVTAKGPCATATLIGATLS